MLSVLIPCYNEKDTILEIIDRVLKVPLDLEIIIVDDCSKDGTREILREYEKTKNAKVQIYYHDRNQGKGAAVRTALSHAKGNYVVVQDADLEYDPNDFVTIVQKFNDEKVNIVYGNRWHDRNQKHSYFSFFIGGLVVTFWTNILYFTNIHDEPTCYKAFRKSVIDSILPIKSRGFEFCPEVTGKLLRKGFKIHEVPISYAPRSIEEGKKITWRDGFKALWVLTKIRFTGEM